MSAPRAVVLVTGTEVLGGWISDRNGPWLAGRLGALGVEHVATTVVGDRPEDLRAELAHARDRGIDVVLTSGGLGPTEDDLTAQIVAEFSGRPLALDVALEARIWRILEPMSRRWKDISADAVRAANRKQALVPAGATVLEPVGTAPGLIVPPTDDDPARPPTPTVVVLPGPPYELQRMWAATEDLPAFRAAIRGAVDFHEDTLRLYGIPESELANTMVAARAAGVDVDRLEITTCARRGELEVVTRWTPEQEEEARGFADFLAARHADTLFSVDGRTIDVLVTDLLAERGWRVATAESCTGGLLAGRLTERAGSSRVVAGGVVAYANAVKERALGVPAELLREHGAVSAPVAEAMARGAIAAVGADVAISTTGVAGPDGGTEEKPVGTVFVAVRTAAGDGLVRRL
ncbi:competence/damage-inducible protein A, partial [Patulibacter sp. S7RM1-6]